MKYLLSTITLLTFVLSSCANVPTATEAGVKTQIEVVGGNEELLREFIRQWVVPWYTGPQDVIVYIGNTSTDIPYALPTPEDSRVIGSITGKNPEAWVDYLLIFDSSLTSESIHEFYAKSLKDKGWQEAPSNQGNGFFHSDTYRGYCYGENEAFLSVETRSLSAENTTVGLRLDTNPVDLTACNLDRNSELFYLNRIPVLRPPKGVTIQDGGGETSDLSAQMTANLKGDLSAAEVIDSYNEQLLAAGWEMVNGGHEEEAAWSNWTFQDEQGADWIGSLIVVRSWPERNYLFAVVTIEKTK